MEVARYRGDQKEAAMGRRRRKRMSAEIAALKNKNQASQSRVHDL